MPGYKPKGAVNANLYMGKTLFEKHPAGAIEAYSYHEGQFDYIHK